MDLHIHTCLSPCGDRKMVPSLIAGAAVLAGLDGIAVTDHNCAANVRAVREAGGEYGLSVMGGMEITTAEEVHVLSWFDDDDALLDLQAFVARHLDGRNDPDFFGEQLVVNANDEVIDQVESLLIGATDLSLEDVVTAVHRRGGLALAAHIDRPSYSVVSQLGFVPADVPFDGIEISSHGAVIDIGGGKLTGGAPAGAQAVSFSDAHFLEDIGRSSTWFRVECISVMELGKALRGEDGRAVVGKDG